MKRRIFQRKWCYLQIGGPIYTWMIEIGRFGISWERNHKSSPQR